MRGGYMIFGKAFGFDPNGKIHPPYGFSGRFTWLGGNMPAGVGIGLMTSPIETPLVDSWTQKSQWGGALSCPFFWSVRLPLGSSSASYANSDIEGTTVILGNGYFSGFSFNARQAPLWSLQDSTPFIVCLLDLQSTILNCLPTVLCRIMPNLRWAFKLVFISFHSTHRINMKNWFGASV